MADVVPVIFLTRRESRRLSAGGRALAFVVALAALGVLIRAATLSPNPAGVGTHLSMGMARCAFLDRTGLPCPACGMTTSFAWFAHGNLLASVYVQPMGAVLAFLSAIAVWAGAYIALTGRPAHRALRILPGAVCFWCLIGLAVAGWGWKMLIHINHWDGWHL